MREWDSKKERGGEGRKTGLFGIEQLSGSSTSLRPAFEWLSDVTVFCHLPLKQQN
jgi:hypothetical protein